MNLSNGQKKKNLFLLIKTGKKFVIDLADKFTPLGTPDDIKKFEQKG